MPYWPLGLNFSCSKIFMVITFLLPSELLFILFVDGLNDLQHVL